MDNLLSSRMKQCVATFNLHEHAAYSVQCPCAQLSGGTAENCTDDMQAETEFCHNVLENTEQMQEQLYREMRGRIQEADQSAPVRYCLSYHAGGKHCLSPMIFCMVHKRSLSLTIAETVNRALHATVI